MNDLRVIPLEPTKEPNQKAEYSDQKISELIKCTEDPLYFIKNYMTIQHPLKGSVPFQPFPYQERMIEAFHEHRFVAGLLSRQMGKALALDTPIPTPTGWTVMGQIKVGDQVLGDDGCPVTVDFVTDSMLERECFQVEFDNGEIITADAEHVWQVGSTIWSNEEPRQLTTSELLPWLTKAKRQGRGIYVTTADPLNLPAVELPIAPYTLGVWLGDGNSRDARFCGHVDDNLEMREAVMADGFELSEVRSDKRNNVKAQNICGLRTKLSKADLLQNKHIPQEYLRASREQRLELLQGLMDTDGHAASTGGFDFYQKDKVLAEQVFELVASLGMKPRLKKKIVNGILNWKIRFATTRMNVFKLARKQAVAARMSGHSKNHRFFFASIMPVESVPVKCIRVKNKSHLFLAGRSMIPTHNTTSAGAYLLWKAMFTPNCTILIVAHNYNGALEIMNRVRYGYETTPNFLRPGVTEYNKGSISFDNGSRIISRATSAHAARGLSVTLLFIDEFSFVAPNVAREFWAAIRPVLSTGGSCIITTTPKSDTDQFAEIWKEANNRADEFGNDVGNLVGKNGFYPLKVIWDQHPERGTEWERIERGSMGDAKFRQEHCCEFVTDDLTLIDPIFLSEMKYTSPDSYTGQVRWYKPIEPNKTYLAALDPSFGTGSDYSAIEVFELPSMEQVAEWSHNRTQLKDQVGILKEILHIIDDEMRASPPQRGEPQIFWTVENNNMGAASVTVIGHTGEENFPGMFLSEKRKKGASRAMKGMLTTGSSKKAACVRFKSLLETHRMTLHSQELIKELKSFVTNANSASAKSGEHDDLVSATLLCVRMLEQVTAWDESFEDLHEVIKAEEGGEDPPAFVF